MKALSLLAVLVSISTSLRAQNFEWVKRFGSSGQARGQAITVDPLGNVIVTGFFEDTVDFDPGPGTVNLSAVGARDVFVQKLDPSGNLIWARSYGGANDEQPNSISVDASGCVYTIGSFSLSVDFDPGADSTILTSEGGADIFVQKLDASGNFLWAISFGGNSLDRGNSITVDDVGNFYIAGEFSNTVDFDPGLGVVEFTSEQLIDVFVMKFDPVGEPVWIKTFGGTGTDEVASICVDASGNVYATGHFESAMNFDALQFYSSGGYDSYVVKLSSLGSIIWVKVVEGEDVIPFSIDIDASGNVYTTGYFRETADFDPGSGITNLTSEGDADVFIQKYDQYGSLVWAKSFGGDLDDYGYSLSVDASENVYITGSFLGTSDFDPGVGVASLTSEGSLDLYVERLDASGNFVWVRTFTGNDLSNANSICLDASGNIYTTGYFQGTVDFDPGAGVAEMTASGDWDVYVHKLIQANVNGYVFVDANNNGIMDQGELPVYGQSIVYGNGNYVANTTADGFFRAFPQEGFNTFSYSQLPNNYINTTPLSQSLNVQLTVIDTLYYGIEPAASINDLKVQIHPVAFPRPGFSRNYQIDYQNVGTTSLNNVVLKFLKSAEDTFDSSSGSFTVTNDTVVWSLGMLTPFSFGSQTVQLTLSTIATLGDSTHIQAWITPMLNDVAATDNYVSLKEEIIGSYDPNDKRVIPETSEPSVNDPLEYTIRFQNTGTYQADFVVIRDTLDALLDIGTFQMISASHSYNFEISNRVATWTFAQIYLPDSTSDEPGSHGYVKFKIKRVAGLGLGTEIPNHAAIYFDYNPPIITNTSIFTIESLVVGFDAAGNSVNMVVYPNPTTEGVHVMLNQALDNVELSVTNILGKEIFWNYYDSLSQDDIELPNSIGVYFLSVTTPTNRSVIKLIKQ